MSGLGTVELASSSASFSQIVCRLSLGCTLPVCLGLSVANRLVSIRFGGKLGDEKWFKKAKGSFNLAAWSQIEAGHSSGAQMQRKSVWRQWSGANKS